MNCQTFERWLDEGGSGTEATEAAAHAESCASCARAWRAAISLERALAAPPMSAPAGFTDRVMVRVKPARSPVPLQGVATAPAPPAMPWWIRAAGDPVTVLALGLAAVAAWGWDGLWGLVAAARSALTGLTPPSAILQLPPAVALGLEMAAATLFALVAPGLHRLVSRLATTPMTRG